MYDASMIRWFDEIGCYIRCTTSLRSMREVVEAYLAERDELEGYCCACEAIARFRLPKGEPGHWVSLRESFVCQCGLNGRMRMMYRAIAEAIDESDSQPSVLMFERITPFFAALSKRFPFVQGCEYVAEDAAPGSFHRIGGIDVRHENMMALSAGTGTLDLICHADVLEHIPDHRRALAECARVLAPGGRLLFTCPFFELDEHVVRAVIEHGKLVHLLPPGYHGNPMSTGGSLVFTHFGRSLFNDIRAAGFSRTRIGLFYDPFQGIVSNNNPYPEGFMWPVLFEGQR